MTKIQQNTLHFLVRTTIHGASAVVNVMNTLKKLRLMPTYIALFIFTGGDWFQMFDVTLLSFHPLILPSSKLNLRPNPLPLCGHHLLLLFFPLLHMSGIK